MLLKTIAAASLLVSCVIFACAGWAFWTLPLLFVGIYAIELVVAVIQAYVFTVLSAVYVQLAESEH